MNIHEILAKLAEEFEKPFDSAGTTVAEHYAIKILTHFGVITAPEVPLTEEALRILCKLIIELYRDRHEK